MTHMANGKNDSCRVVNKYKTDKWDVDIQRGTKWGNPCKGTRGEAIAGFIPYFQGMIRTGQITLDELRELDGKVLACTCAPLPCHGDYIAHCVNVLCNKGNRLDV